MPAVAEFFARYPNPVFIETGTYECGGIESALKAGFPRVISIELSEKYFAAAAARYAEHPRVEVLRGDSQLVLPAVLDGLQQQATFWLDAHWSGGDMAFGGQNSPILEELLAIARHPINTHTILIDDLRLFDNPRWPYTSPDYADNFGVTWKALLDGLQAINPGYEIAIVSGGSELVSYPDILTAVPG